MINVTRLLRGAKAPGDGLRYGENHGLKEGPPPQKRMHHRPVVVWNITRRCNLHCAHCYSESQNLEYQGELAHSQACAVVDDLSLFQVPTLLLSGGEPLLRHDLVKLVHRATSQGLRTGLSTNGTLITPQRAQALKQAGLGYVGISLDGLRSTNDKFRGTKSAFDGALSGIRISLKAGFRVSLRFTLTRWNVADLDAMFDLVEQEGIHRLCIYHLAYAGRGMRILPFDLNHGERRKALDLVLRRSSDLYDRGVNVEVLTVANHADAPYILRTLAQRDPQRAAQAYKLLKRNGGNSSGKGIACIDSRGAVHPDQFWRTRSLGNVLDHPFSHLWQDSSSTFLHKLRNRKPLLEGRCQQCAYLDLCNGNLRCRGEAATGSPWGQDPACYLTDQEISEGITTLGVGV